METWNALAVGIDHSRILNPMEQPPTYDALLGNSQCLPIKVLVCDHDLAAQKLSCAHLKSQFQNLLWFRARLNRAMLEQHEIQFSDVKGIPGAISESSDFQRGGFVFCKIGCEPLNYQTFGIVAHYFCRFGDPYYGESSEPSLDIASRESALVGFVCSFLKEGELKILAADYSGNLEMQIPDRIQGEELKKVLDAADALLRHYYPMPPKRYFSRKQQSRAIRIWRECCRGNHSLILSRREEFIS